MGTRLDVVGTTGGKVTLETVVPRRPQPSGTGGTIRGVVGRITWGYFDAATINGYTVTRSVDNRWSVSATVVTKNDYNLRQRPLHFVAPHAKGEWRWPIDAIDMGTDEGPTQLRATLGPPLP